MAGRYVVQASAMIRRSMTEPCQMWPLAVPVCALNTAGSFAIGALTRVVTLNYHPVILMHRQFVRRLVITR